MPNGVQVVKEGDNEPDQLGEARIIAHVDWGMELLWL